MKKRILQKIGAVCTSAVLSTTALFATNSVSALPAKAADTDNYAKLLQYSLYFYDANMCGQNSDCAIEWRGSCHTSDEIVGGYHDAGDHVMFGLPQGYTASTLGWIYYEYKNTYNTLGLTDHYKTISKHFTDFFKKSTILSGNSVSKFLYQKGEGNDDHKYWGAPENQNRNQMYWTTNGASDIAAEYAAALALDYINFGDEESLKYAKALYQFSCQHNQVATEGVQGFYLSNDAKTSDDQAWAAAWLHIATKDGSYLNDAKSKVTQYLGWAHAWGNTDLGAAAVIAEITNDWSKVNGYLNSVCSGSNYLCMDGWGSARYNCSMQFVSLVASKHSSANFSSWAKGQMNIILGQNQWNTSFVVGWDNTSPTHCHHRAASGLSDANTDQPNKYVLVGALVGGPNKSGYYADKRDEYETNEVALDYQVGLVGAAAALYDVYGTGSTVTSIPGVKNVSVIPTTPGTTTTQDPGNPTTTTTPAPIPSTPGGQKNATYTGGDGTWNIDVSGATKLTLTLKTNSNDTETNGRFTVNGEDTRWEATPNNGVYTVEFDVPSGASNVTFQVWWPTSSTLESAVLTMSGSPAVTTTTKATTTTTKTTTTTTRTTTTTTTTSTTPRTTTTTTTTTTTPAPIYATKWGDVNCDNFVDVSDAVLLARFIAEDSTIRITEQGLVNADVTHDNNQKSDDVTKILKFVAFLIDENALAQR